MNYWLENSVRNLLPLSKATTFSEALAEWVFSGTVFDYEIEDDEIHCELCEHPDLAHHFEIRNSYTDRSLLVGSSCILKFSEIEVRDSRGKAVTDRNERESMLKHALRNRVIESGLEPLRKLWVKDKANRYRIEVLATTLKEDDGIAPSDLLFLLQQMTSRGLKYQARIYKISLRSDVNKAELLAMKLESLRMLLPALSKDQLHKLRSQRTDI